MADPFRPRSAPTSGFGRALRSKRAVTFEAIEDLFASCACVREVSPDSVQVVCSEFNVDLARKFRGDRRDLYRRYLAHCLEDKVLTEEENADLQHLRLLLHLSPEDVTPIHDEVAREVYGQAIQEVLSDLELDEEEERFLRRLRGELALSENVAAALYDEGRRSARDRALSEASARDREFSVYRTPAGEFTGRSDASLEAAIDDALSKAAIAIPKLHWFEVSHIAGYVGESRAKSWHVAVRAGIHPERD